MDNQSSYQYRDLSKFRTEHPFELRLGYFLWVLFGSKLLAYSTFGSSLKRLILRVAGAKIGKWIVLKSNLRVHFPWNLEIGDHCWIGEEVWFINHEKVTLGNHVCISQRAIICSGGHDYQSVSLAYQHAPVTIGDGAWVCLGAKVLPGTRIGKGSVIAAGEVARGEIPDFHMLIGGKLKAIEPPIRP